MVIGLLVAASAAAFQVQEKSAVLTFDYHWPSQASAIPQLRRRLVAQMNHDRSRYTKMAEADRAERASHHFPFFPYSFSRSLHFGGRSARLVSFADERNAFTGGAHGNPSTSALLWDKAVGRTINFGDLFASSPVRLLQPTYCERLAEQRKKKNGSDEVPDTWARCPNPMKLTIIPEDKNHDGRFETINVTANPYDVGSYAEGYYIALLPVTPALLNALKTQYRSSFEVQRQ